jgi:predicted dienelactone hydrolase
MLNHSPQKIVKKLIERNSPYWRLHRSLIFISPLILGLSLILTACPSISDNTQTLADTSSTPSDQPMLTHSKYETTPGPYNVKIVENIELTKPSGDPLPLKIYYPDEKQKFPIVIFSHGTGGSKDDYGELGRFWASHGYIVLHPTHEDSLALRGESAGGGNLRRILAQILRDPDSWQQRFKDISIVIDSLKKLENDVPELKGKMNINEIGVGGHSYGAYTAQVIGGATIDLPNGKTEQSFADHRVKSVLLLSPQGAGQQGLTRSSWNHMTLPMMVMTGSLDGGAQGQGPEWKMEPFEFAPPGNKYLVFIQKAHHFSFGGRGEQPQENQPLGRQARQQQTIFNYVKIASLSYWDAYLKNNEEAKKYLKNQQLAKDSNQAVSISTK